MKKILLFYLALNTFLHSQAQKEATHWYFGNGAGISFNSGMPVSDNTGQLYTNEGCAIVSDKNGNLLFYTDGVEVFNNNHVVMPNGSNLGGGSSSTQSAIILKKPGNEFIYYIFTVAELAGDGGLQYSIVDMRKQNGKGEVTVKNQKLIGPISEKLTAVKHTNGKGWWVICHQWNTNAFYSYHFDESGISQPVISTVGVVHKNRGSLNNSESVGYLKASPDGKRLASVISYIPNNTIELFDFNDATGGVSNKIDLSSPGNAYGVCFSPDNSKLYVSYESGGNGVVQYDLSVIDIAKTAIRVSPIDDTRYGAMQVGPDGKIYVAKLGVFLDVIQSPNLQGTTCGFKSNAFNLNGVYSTFGLPDFFVLNSTSLKVNLGTDSVICDKNYILDAKNPGARYLWSTGETSNTITVSKNGSYWVKVNKDGAMASDTIKLKFRKALKLDLGNDTTVCGEILPLDAGNPGAQYHWSVGVATQIYVATKTGTYGVTVSDGICTKSDSVKIVFAGKSPSFIPMKAFLPNNGGFNDRFDYILKDITSFHIKVYSSRGKLMFDTESMKERWLGIENNRSVKRGKYKWEVKYKSKCSGNKIIEEKGVVIVQ